MCKTMSFETQSLPNKKQHYCKKKVPDVTRHHMRDIVSYKKVVLHAHEKIASWPQGLAISLKENMELMQHFPIHLLYS